MYIAQTEETVISIQDYACAMTALEDRRVNH